MCSGCWHSAVTWWKFGNRFYTKKNLILKTIIYLGLMLEKNCLDHQQMWNVKPEDQFSVPLPCGRYKKNISDSRTSGSSPSGTPQNGSGQFISEYVEYVVVLFFFSYCCSFCCYCYYFKFSQNWVSISGDICVVVVAFVLMLLIMMMMLLFYPRNLPLKVWSKLRQ